MITYLQHHQIDFTKWDSCVNYAINGIIYPYSFYLNQVSPGWEALIYKDYEAVMPLPVKKKWGVWYIIQPLFVQQLGVFSNRPVDENMIEAFLVAIPRKFRYVNIPLNTYNPLKIKEKYASRTSKTYELDLISPYDQIQRGYSGQTRRNLKKAKQERVFIIRNTDPMPLIESFRKNRGKSVSNLQESSYETLKHLIYSGIHRGDTQVYSAYSKQNTFCAGVVFFTSHKKSILIFSGSTPEARTNGAMTAIIDTFIQDHAGINLTLDFEGSNEENLARFYAGFGSKECVFLQLEMQHFPLMIKPLVNMYLRLRK